MTRPARVCVFALRTRRAAKAEQAKPRDGAASPPRGRVRCTRQATACTTTNYILELVCSSIGRESNFILRLAGGASA
jgi:hypothetical protein